MGSSAIFIALIILINVNEGYLNSIWRWECINGYCEKIRNTPDTADSALSLSACRLFCHSHANLWPQPTGQVHVGNILLNLDSSQIEINSVQTRAANANFLDVARKRFKKNIDSIVPIRGRLTEGRAMNVLLNITDVNSRKLTLSTDEGYEIRIAAGIDGPIKVDVSAATIVGSRHALETLGQLIIYDDIRGRLQLPRDVYITDKPVYPYRGILLDTARNYISVATIKRTIDGMAASKLNTFHWHITDSQSFPYVSKSQPILSQLGAYDSNEIYTPEDVQDVVSYAEDLGIRVLPEFDAPAHVGEGWQDTDFVACFNKKPWQDFCVEPPCGQFDPTKLKLYDAIEGIYQDMIEQFKPDLFHMGGDEVSTSCWNSTESIVKWMADKGWERTEADFMKLWDFFQSRALERVNKHAGTNIPIIMWTSTLTKKEYVETYLPKDRYIIQVWTTGDDAQISDLLEKGYRLIMSNYDALYFDCGFAGWVTDGNNWCSPYIGWQKVYSNSPASIAGSKKDQILGGEAALWTEQVDDYSVDGRLWPRAAALAERLWAEPSNNWRDAEARMLVHRERLVKRGIAADSLEPQWCMQNEENCPIKGVHNG